jgi:3-oxoacyl-[acyl-carrier protein] reductase
MELTGKVALVLGAIKGIGKGIALALLEKGVKVAVIYHDWAEHLDTLKANLAGFPGAHCIIKANLLETDTIQDMVTAVVDHFGRLDILINNIERGGWPVVHGPYKQDQWDLELATTLRAKRWVFDAALPYLKAAGNGCVINFSSIAGMVGRSGPARYIFNDGYAAANRGVSLLTETWARLGAPEVRVNEIMLGFVETRHGEYTRGWSLLTDGQKQAVLDHTLLRRTGTVSDVVEAVILVLNTPFMTGSILRLDGGYLLGGEEIGPMPPGVI